jgi:DNA-binding CsgD family transcriptional regulator
MTRPPQSSAKDGLDKSQTSQSFCEDDSFSIPHLKPSGPPEADDQKQPSIAPPVASFHRETSQNADETPAPRDVLAALTFGLDLVQHGAMLVAAEGRPRLTNRAALAILQKKDGLWLSRNGLVADRASDTRLLQMLLQDAMKSPELGEPKDSPITLQRRTARSSLIVRVVPGPGLDCWPGTENRTALLKLYDQDLGLEVDGGDLCRLYGLTRGEAALAVLLVRGKSIEEAAVELFISPHTARTHLKRIFMKTDTHRQTELVVRILTVVL